MLYMVPSLTATWASQLWAPYFLNWSLFFIYSKESQELYEELKEEMKNLTMPTFVYNSLLHVYGFHGKTVISINYNSDGKLSVVIW